MLTCKSSVRFKAFTPALLHILDSLSYLDECGDALALPKEGLVITSANDSKHMERSRHYTNEALDLRSKSFPSLKAKHEFAQALRRDLGEQFTVLLEGLGTDNEHFHIQVRKGTTYSSARAIDEWFTSPSAPA